MKLAEQTFKHVERAIVARMNCIGHADRSGLRIPIYEYLTIWRGNDAPCIAVKFKGQAVSINGELSESNLSEGDVVLPEGLIYRPIPMTGQIMTAHLQAMRTFKPKVGFIAEKGDEPAVDMGTLTIN